MSSLACDFDSMGLRSEGGVVPRGLGVLAAQSFCCCPLCIKFVVINVSGKLPCVDQQVHINIYVATAS